MKLLVLLASAVLGPAAVAQTLPPGTVAASTAPEDQATEWLHFLGRMSATGLLEPAGSHGSIGVGVAAGASSHLVPEGNGLAAAALDRGQEDGGAYYVPRLWLVKGLPWPVDVGLSAAAAPDGAFTEATAHAQWTVYEAFKRPALAVRASYGRLFGLEGTELRSTGVAAVGSYGFLRYFQLYGSVGAVRHEGTLTVTSGDPELAYLLTAAEPELDVSKSWYQVTRAAGLRVTVWPPFVTATVEAQAEDRKARSYAAKLGIGM